MLLVRIVPRAGRFMGRLVVRELDGSEAERTVVGETCAEVVSALALIAAVAIDPTAAAPKSSSNEPVAAASTNTTPSATSAALAAENPPTKPEQRTESHAPPEQPPTVPDENAPKPPSNEASNRAVAASPHTWHVSLGADGEVGTGSSPTLWVSVPAFVELWRRPTGAGIFAPGARIRFERAGSGVVASSTGSAKFTWTKGSLDLCPIAWSFGSVRLQPCARAEAGVVEASGVDVQPGRTNTRPWVTAGSVARGRWTVLDPLFVEVETAALVPIVRDRFFLETNNTTVFQAGVVAWTAAAGAGLSIW
jgi:hypothetical protein